MLWLGVWLFGVAAICHPQRAQAQTPPNQVAVDTSAILDGYLRGRHAMTGERPILVECHSATLLPRIPAPAIKALLADRMVARFELTCDNVTPIETREGVRRALVIVSIKQDSVTAVVESMIETGRCAGVGERAELRRLSAWFLKEIRLTHAGGTECAVITKRRSPRP